MTTIFRCAPVFFSFLIASEDLDKLYFLLWMQLYLSIFVPSSWLTPSYDIFLEVSSAGLLKKPNPTGKGEEISKQKDEEGSNHTDRVRWGQFLVFRHTGFNLQVLPQM